MEKPLYNKLTYGFCNLQNGFFMQKSEKYKHKAKETVMIKSDRGSFAGEGAQVDKTEHHGCKKESRWNSQAKSAYTRKSEG